ncbi:hypothetical protein BDN71DRAFT_1484895 [Pleurotus eryngii]|uniref:Protein YOP1 n=1 Tax=Pleurotus eryngii TaxID=5323 RepID=A0A9P5ZK23_PLEER|nr:hypothetical protein BDN71DRAFT_1484895 [Pleurotus eryngii]
MSAAQKVQQHPIIVDAQNKASYYVNQLDKELNKYPVLINLERRTEIPKVYTVLGAFALLTALHLINPLAAPVSNLIGWGLPAYLSFKAIESPQTQDDVQWLTYWTVFGFFNFLESFALRALLYYVPWYFAFKTIFIVWLQLPAFRGAQSMYHTILKPIVSNLGNAQVVAPHPDTTADNLRDRAQAATSE